MPAVLVLSCLVWLRASCALSGYIRAAVLEAALLKACASRWGALGLAVQPASVALCFLSAPYLIRQLEGEPAWFDSVGRVQVCASL